MRGYFCSLRIQQFKYVVADWVANNLAFLLFDIFRFIILSRNGLYGGDLTDFISQTKLLIEQAIIPTALLGVYWISGFYNNPFHKSRLQELFVTLGSALFSSIIIYLLLFTNDQLTARRENYEVLLLLFLSLSVFVYPFRLAITTFALKKFIRHDWSFSTLIIGNSSKARVMAENLRGSGNKYGYNVLGFVRIPGESEEDDGEKVYELFMLPELKDKLHIDQLIISPENLNEKRLLSILDTLFPLGIPIKIDPDILSYITSSVRLQDIFGEPFVDLSAPVMGDMSRNIKRSFDVISSLLALIILSPLYIAIAIAVKADSKGSIFYSQQRIGRHRKPFKIYKFRSMRTDAEASGPQLSNGNDPRITRTGRILRKYRLDELPQFWNVLTGDMSIVGPRPEREYYIRQILKRAPYYILIHQVRPGITSWGMVKFGYASTVDEMVKRTLFDLIYLSNMSLSVDAKIMIYTVRTIFKGSGK